MSDAQTILDRLNNEKAGLPYLSAQMRDVATKDHAQFLQLYAAIMDVKATAKGVGVTLAGQIQTVLDTIDTLRQDGEMTPDAESALIKALSDALDGATITLKGGE